MRKIKWLFIFILILSFQKKAIPIYIKEYGIEIREVSQLGDTLNYNKSGAENFKLVFFDTKGKCYCEQYYNGILKAKGYYENSLDTLKEYISGRGPGGRTHTSLKVRVYYQPIRNGEWVFFKDGEERKIVYKMGIALGIVSN